MRAAADPSRRRGRRRAVVFAAVSLVLLGCDPAGRGSGPDEAPSPEDGGAEDPTQEGESTDGSSSDGQATDPALEPAVPSLHPEVDALPEAVAWLGPSSAIEPGDGLPPASDEVVRVDLKVAETSAQQRRGLMEVEELPAGVGMLFWFGQPRTGGFWMWNTLVPLDIAFLDADGEILAIRAMDPCDAEVSSACPSYDPEVEYSAALEVPQGWFADHGVGVGDRMVWTDPTDPEPGPSGPADASPES